MILRCRPIVAVDRFPDASDFDRCGRGDRSREPQRQVGVGVLQRRAAINFSELDGRASAGQRARYAVAAACRPP